MRVRIGLLTFFLGATATCVGLTATVRAQQAEATKQEDKPGQANVLKQDEAAEGEKRFETNCGRCHQPPQDLSPREARAVLRQMRVRANLSAEDERLILKFIAP